MLAKNAVIQEVGFLDETTFLYSEEAILSEKLFKSGFKILFYPKVLVSHKQSSTISDFYSHRKSRAMLFKTERYYFKHYREINFIGYLFLLIGQFIWLNVWIPLMAIRRKFKKLMEKI